MTSPFSYRPGKDRQQYHLQVPPSSPFFQMPNVFVIPPEEEQFETPPWCYFDAAQASPLTSTQYSTSPDFDSLDIALNLVNQPEPASHGFYRSQPHPIEEIVMPKKPEKRSRLEYIADSAVGDFQAISQSGNDSMVVEVVKVRRSDIGDAASAMKRSKTFKSRASKAFRSIKNVGRTIKPSAKDVWLLGAGTQTTSESTEELQPDLPPRDRGPARSKRSSVVLSQLFQPPKTRSTCDLDYTQNSIPPQLSLVRSDISPSLDGSSGLPMDTDVDVTSLRAASPTPSTAKSTSSKKRFSILDIHRLFSFPSSPSAPTQPVSPPPSASSTPSMSREPSTTSSTSIDTPDTPMDAFPAPVPTPLSTIRTSSSFRDSIESVKDYGDGEWRSTLVLDEPGRDMSCEMRLNSLHFDSLSFDPDYF